MSDKCDRCGEPMSLLNDTNPFHCKCNSCGHEMWFLADPPTPEPSAADLVSVEVVLQWAGNSPTHQELLALKQFLPELQNMPIIEVARRGHATSSWPLGTHPLYHARGLRSRAEQCGLQLAWIVTDAKPLLSLNRTNEVDASGRVADDDVAS